MRTDGGHRQATWLELFFDLCLVVAIAALARAFHADPLGVGTEPLTERAAEAGDAGGEVAAAGPAAFEGLLVAGESVDPVAAALIVAGGIAAFWPGTTPVNLANLGFRLTVSGRRVLPARFAAAIGLIAMAFAELEAVAFAAVAAATMLALNVYETVLIRRARRERLAVPA